MVRIRVYRECLTTIYAGGLRLLEGARIQIADIDSGRMLLHIHGKGNRDRDVPLPPPLLPRLRAYWRTHRSRAWLFPAPTRRSLPHSLSHHGGPVTRSSLQSAFRRAWRKSGMAKRARRHETRRVTLPGVEFLQRFLQHVLPRGCAKVRYYGLWSAAHRADRTRARALLTALTLIATPQGPELTRASSLGDLPRCPHCRVGTLIVIAVLRPSWSRPP